VAITYTWTFTTLDVQTSAFDHVNVVYNVNFIVTGDDGAGHTAQYEGSCPINYIEDDPFIDYPSLTQADVQGWVNMNMPAEQQSSIEYYVAAQIQNQIDPPLQALAPPWN
jgi:hypothetical protein